ncbi:helix-turn-helix domain-containing protein [Arenibacter troitsensis]|uniref:DNA binding domain-containing protein, excisionase family n=1 Tax=Arenibacter troitsensis TaxID=188872 RepID=A0A1X7L8A1_9FLAO|nr:helix-turn-helix domain-containing protein [Arenibacter troitsensis]SMG49714.1 DNA binding domain-containing protein, excisionase family [Arenibacter troitsensis]
MGKLMLSTLELSDIKKVVEEVIENKLKNLNPQPEKEGLKLLSRKDTAKLLCISLPTLHDWTKTGIVKAHRIGNRILYKLEEVNDALSMIQTSKNERGLSC